MSPGGLAAGAPVPKRSFWPGRSAPGGWPGAHRGLGQPDLVLWLEAFPSLSLPPLYATAAQATGGPFRLLRPARRRPHRPVARRPSSAPRRLGRAAALLPGWRGWWRSSSTGPPRRRVSSPALQWPYALSSPEFMERWAGCRVSRPRSVRRRLCRPPGLLVLGSGPARGAGTSSGRARPRRARPERHQRSWPWPHPLCPLSLERGLSPRMLAPSPLMVGEAGAAAQPHRRPRRCARTGR